MSMQERRNKLYETLPEGSLLLSYAGVALHTNEDDYYSFDSSKDETRDLADIKEKILGKTFDDRLMIVSGVKKNYDLDTDDPEFETTLAEKVKNDSKVEFFPSSDGSRVLPQAAKLTHDDYDATSVKYDPSTHMATITLTGKGEYSGTHERPCGNCPSERFCNS